MSRAVVLGAAARRALVFSSRAAPLRKTIHFLPRALALRNVAAAVRPITISALMRSPAAATKSKAKSKTTKGSTTKTTAAKKSPAAKKVASKTKPKPKPKKVAAKKKPAAKKAVKKPKKVELTEEQKERKELLKLKKMALLKGPDRLPDTTWTVYITDNVRKGDGPVTDKISSLASSFKNISDSQREQLASTAESNKAINEKKRLEWLHSYPIEAIYMANIARRRLAKRLDRKKVYLIHDARLPERALSGYVRFIKANFAKGDHESASSAFKDMSEKWKAMSDAEKAPYLNQAAAAAEKSAAYLKILRQRGNAYWKEHA